MAMQVEGVSAAGSLEEGEEEDGRERSTEDLKAQLYRTLKVRGVLSQLQSQLRCRLVQELRVGSHDPAPPPVPLGLQVANSVVADHLRGCGYQYTLSTFLPESHTDLHTLVSREDVLCYLHIRPPNPLHSALSTDTGRGFLRDLLDSLSNGSVGVAKCDHTHSVGVQTEGREGDGTVAERLRELDEQHRAQLARGQEEEEREGGRGTEQCRRETEEQLREEMEREVQKFRESELAKVREEERTRCETKLRNLRIEQEESHRQKMESLRRLEMAAVDDARRRQLEGEAALFARRQELEVQLVAVGAREEQLRRETESRMQALSLAEQRLTVAAEQVALRERELLQYRDRVEGVVRAELAGWESRLKEEQSRQDSARVEFDQAREAVRLERGRREEVEGQLHKASKQLVELQTQREESLRAIEKMSDYWSLKQQLTVLKAQLSRTEKRLSENRTESRRMQAEQQEIIRGLRRQLGRPGDEHSRTSEEVERVKRECQLQMSEAEEENRKLRVELSRQVSVVSRQRVQLEEQTLGLREMEREVHDLTSQLAHWQNTLIQHKHKSVRAHRPPAHVSLSPPPHTLTPSHPPPDLGGGETRERLEEETDLLYQQFQHTFPAITSSHHHTPTPVISVGVASSVGVTSSHSAPLTHLTTFTKTTPSLAPTYQLTKTTPTSIPKTTPTARTIVSSSSLITSDAGTKTTPTISEAPPTATPTNTAIPTSFQAGPSLDQLWKVSSQHTNRNETSITPNNAPSVSSPPCHTLTTAAVVSTPSLPTPPPITAPAEAILTKYMELASQERAAGETGGGGGGNSGREGLKDLSISEHSPENEVQSLSQATDSFGGVSDGNKSSDPFQDW